MTLLAPGAEAVLDPGQTCAVTLRHPSLAVTPAAMAATVTDPTPPASLPWLQNHENTCTPHQNHSFSQMGADAGLTCTV